MKFGLDFFRSPQTILATDGFGKFYEMIFVSGIVK